MRFTRLLPSCQAKTIKKQQYQLPENPNPSRVEMKKELQANAAPHTIQWCRDQDLNQGHSDFQSDALPTELSRRHPK